MIIYYLKNIFLSLKYNLFRTFLTGIGILIGIASLVIIFTVSDSFSENLKKELSGENISIGLTSNNLDDENFNRILESSKVEEAVDKVTQLEHVKQFEAEKPEELILFYYLGESKDSVAFEFNDDINVNEGKDFNNSTGNVVIVKTLADFNSNYKVGTSICINGIMYKIIGFTSDDGKDGGVPVLFFPEYLDGTIKPSDYEKNGIFEMKVEGENSYIVDKAINILNQSLPNGYKFINYTEEIDASISQALSSISLFIGLIAMISLIVAAINVSNIMYISILERKGEVAIYRALGMKKGEVKIIFLLEAMIIVLVFSILGYLIGISIAYIILTILRMDIIINFKNIILVILLSMITGVVSGYRPAKLASDSNTSDILK